jgi:tetratricopeptide (TPR) repeat protein
MKLVFSFILALFITNQTVAQKKVTISLVGSVMKFNTTEKIFGATIYMIQNGKTIAKGISDQIGIYAIVGTINPNTPFDLLISKPGFAAKKILFDLDKLKLKNARFTTLQILEDLSIELFENRIGADLSFTKNSYAEKFYWDDNENGGFGACLPKKEFKEEVDKKVKEEYEKAEKNISSKDHANQGDIANKQGDFQKAIQYYDLALKANPNDSTSRIKKEKILKTIKKNEEEKLKKANYDVKKKLADDALNSGQLIDAEKNYNEILKEFPEDSHSINQLAKINNLKKQQEEVKKNKAEVDKLIVQAVSLRNSKKYDDAIKKVQQAIVLAPSQKNDLEKELATIKSLKSDGELEEKLNRDLKNASNLLKEKKYDEAVNLYKTIDQNISAFSNQPLIDKYTNLSKQGLNAIIDKKNSEGEEFMKQLQKAQDNFDKGPTYYSDAEKILKSDPMKSRMNEPSVKELIEKIGKMKDYYTLKSAAYQEVKNNKNEQALSKLKSTRESAKKLGDITPSTEISKLSFSIDSLENIIKSLSINSSKPQTNSINNSGFQLVAPGEVVTENPTDLYKELSDQIESTKSAPFENLTEMKNDIEKEIDFNKKLNASIQEGNMNKLEDSKSEVEAMNIDQEKATIQLQEVLNEKKKKSDVDNYNQQIEKNQQLENRINKIQKTKDQTDSISGVKLSQSDLINENTEKQLEKTKTARENKSFDIQKQNESRTQAVQNLKTSTENNQNKQDSLNRIMSQDRITSIEKSKELPKENKFSANHIKDEKGVEFPWNAMTERVYKIKNKDGQITSIIIRRVVVDKNGYGVVYEQNTNERGVNSYLKNGVPTTEYIWANESTGINVIKK